MGRTIRTLLRIVNGLFSYLVAFIAALGSAKRQCPGDMAARTFGLYTQRRSRTNGFFSVFVLEKIEDQTVFGIAASLAYQLGTLLLISPPSVHRPTKSGRSLWVSCTSGEQKSKAPSIGRA